MMNARNQPTLLLFQFVQKPTNEKDSKATILLTDVEVMLHSFVDNKVGRFAHIML